ncbi:response regulator [Paenibacillus sp. P26]|nr:response regulator [Paenibacillus sp. P26]
MMNPFRVVIADDEPMIRRGMARLIEECGDEWKVLGQFANGCDALEFIKTPGNRLDLLVTDVKMPMMDGLALIREARRHQDFLPLVISGYDDFEYVRAALVEGAIDYVIKPVNRPLFRMQMKEIGDKIRRRKRQKELDLLRQWIHGEESGMTASDWRDTFPEGAYRLLGVSLDEPPHKMRGYTRRDWDLVAYAIGNMLEEIVGEPTQAGCGWTWQGGRKLFWILLYAPKDAEQLAETVRSSILRYTSQTACVSVSGEFGDLHALPDMRDEAISLLYLRLVYGGNRVIAADRTASLSSGALPVQSLQIGQRLRLSIGRDSDEETGKLLDDYLRHIESLSSADAIRQAIQYLILQLFGASMETGHEDAKRRMLSELAPADAHTASFHRSRQQLHHTAKLVSAPFAKNGRVPTGRRSSRPSAGFGIICSDR